MSAGAPTLRVVDIVEGTSVDGPGLRTSIYLAGCDHRCPGCHNPQTWAHDAGHDMTVDEIMQIVRLAGYDVTLTGGDPMYQAGALLPLARAIRDDGHTIWCYTGFTIEQLYEMPDAAALLDEIDVLVDGPFVEALRDTSLLFRGSSNQRIIELRPQPDDGFDVNIEDI
ncbi:MAG: anaerobic ribonucleoside-triphosphate reductase activating protein [Bacteroidales bacterium]|nr:anaerobic ribonucleoside-triphosphate reductase activating protein [Bacteroidales bacterium]